MYKVQPKDLSRVFRKLGRKGGKALPDDQRGYSKATKEQLREWQKKSVESRKANKQNRSKP